MKTTELIAFLKTHPVTQDQGYNLLIEDLYQFVSEYEVMQGQRLIAYFMYKIQEICLPVIEDLRTHQ